MSNLFNKLLVILCVVDMLVIIPNLIFSCEIFFPHSKILNTITPWTDGLCHIAVSASIFMTIAITVERYYAVSSPYTYQIRLNKKGFWTILTYHIIPVILIAVIVNTPKLLQVSNVLSLLPLSYERIIIKAGIIYQVFHPLSTNCIIPIGVLSVLNSKIVIVSRQRSVANMKMSSEIRMARIMIIITSIFVILSMPKMFLTVYEVSTIPNIFECMERKCKYNISASRWVVDAMVRYIVMLNSSTNFIVYCFVSSSFRNTLRMLLFKKNT